MADTSFIIWVQQWSTPFWDSFWRGITFLGDMEYYMLAIPLIYWLYSKKFAFRFALIFLFSAYFNSASKYNFMTERPPLELNIIEQEGFAFPSGHAQGNTVFWGFLAHQIKRNWAYAAAGVLILLVSFSRLYLGVHYPVDVIFGITIGVLAIGLYQIAWERRPVISDLGWYLTISAAAVFLMFLLHSQGDGPMITGFLLGALWGYRLEKDFIGWPEKATPVQNVFKVVLGLVVFFGLREVTRAVLINWPGLTEEQTIIFPIMTWIRYSIMGFWVTLFAPMVFQKLKLFDLPVKEEDQKETKN